VYCFFSKELHCSHAFPCICYNPSVRKCAWLFPPLISCQWYIHNRSKIGMPRETATLSLTSCVLQITWWCRTSTPRHCIGVLNMQWPRGGPSERVRTSLDPVVLRIRCCFMENILTDLCVCQSSSSGRTMTNHPLPFHMSFTCASVHCFSSHFPSSGRPFLVI